MKKRTNLLHVLLIMVCLIYSCNSDHTEIIDIGYNKEESIIINGIYKTNINNKTMVIGSNKWYDIVHNGSRYIVVGDGGYVSTSTDGKNWNSPKKIGTAYFWKSVAYGNGKFVMGGYSGYTSTSTDGVNWTSPVMVKQSASIYSMLFAKDKFISIGSSYVFYSTNGTTWTQGNNTANVCFSYAAYGNGKFVTIGTNSRTLVGYCSTSTDGINWTTPTNFSTSVTWNNIGFGNGKFVAVGESGYVMTSTDGVTWTNLKQITTNSSWLNVIYSNGKFIIVGSNGYISTSADGVTWSTPTQIKDESGNITNAPLYSICEAF